MDWCVVYTNVNKETIAEKNLIGQNFITYMPKYKKIISHARKISTVIKPLFPRYLFVNVDLVAQRWPIINSTYGVNVIISMEGKPVIISEDIINKISSSKSKILFSTLGMKKQEQSIVEIMQSCNNIKL